MPARKQPEKKREKAPAPKKGPAKKLSKARVYRARELLEALEHSAKIQSRLFKRRLESDIYEQSYVRATMETARIFSMLGKEFPDYKLIELMQLLGKIKEKPEPKPPAKKRPVKKISFAQEKREFKKRLRLTEKEFKRLANAYKEIPKQKTKSFSNMEALAYKLASRNFANVKYSTALSFIQFAERFPERFG